ncbi:MAG: hypothetical protein V1661_02575 [bacterium]
MAYKFLDLTQGYIIRLPYDEALGNASIVSVVPMNNYDLEFIKRNEDNILHTEPREKDENLIDFKMRVEAIAEQKRQELKNSNHFN